MPLQRHRTTRQIPCFLKTLLNLSSSGQLPQAVDLLTSLSRKGIRLPNDLLSVLLRRFSRNPTSVPHVKALHLHLKLTRPKTPNTLLWNYLISLYVKCGSLFHARKVFGEMRERRNLYSWNGMINGYLMMGELEHARSLFDEMDERDVVSWNMMIMGYARKGLCGTALELWTEMRRCGMRCTEFTFPGILIVCGKVNDRQLVKQVHVQLLIGGYLGNVVIASGVMDAYTKCGQIKYARGVFDEMQVRDVFAWTTMVSGYARQCNMEVALVLFVQMPERNDVSWTSMISGYTRIGEADKALEFLNMMVGSSIRPNQFTFSSSLCACAVIPSLRHGRQIHGYLVRSNFTANTIVVSSLIDMYSRCDRLGSAMQVFDLLGDKKELVLWKTMISALAHHDIRDQAMEMFDSMIGVGVVPDGVTFTVIISLCSFSGLPEEGLQLFVSLTRAGSG